MASAGSDRTVRIWDVPTGEELLRLRGHTGMVYSLAWHPEGRHLLRTSYDGSAKVWDAVHDLESLTLGPAHGARYVDWTADGKQLMLAGDWGTLLAHPHRILEAE